MASNYTELLADAERIQLDLAALKVDADDIDPNWDLVSQHILEAGRELEKAIGQIQAELGD